MIYPPFVRINQNSDQNRGLVSLISPTLSYGNPSITDMVSGAKWTLTGATKPVWTSGDDRGGLLYYGGSTSDLVSSIGTDLNFGNATTDSPFSVTVWADMADATRFRMIQKALDTATGTLEWSFTTTGADKLYLTCWDDTSANFIQQTSTASAEEGVWRLYSATYDGSGNNTGIKLYIDGILIGSSGGETGTYVAMHNTGITPTIGSAFKNGASAGYALGYMSEARVYNRVLTAGEIFAIYAPPTRWELYRHPDEYAGIFEAGASPETGFELQRDKVNTFDSVDLTLIEPAANEVSYNDTGLDAATEYFYRLRAVNAFGNSAYTATVSDTTSAATSTIPVLLGGGMTGGMQTMSGGLS